MKTKGLLIGFLCLIFSTSCDKDNDIEQVENYTEHARLKRILLYSTVDSKEPINVVEEYEYDSLNRVNKVTSPMYEGGEIVGTIKYDLYEYNANGQVVKISNFNANKNSPTGFINLKNYVYSYAGDGLKEKELIEYPQINSFAYSLYKYLNTRLIKVEKYDNKDQLEVYTKYEYNDLGQLVKELTYSSDGEVFSITKNSYSYGLNTLTEVYSGNQENKIRELNKTYDLNGNLIMIESNELMLYSSLMSCVLKYEYY